MGYDSNDRNDGTFEKCPYCGGEANLKIYEPPFTKSRYYYVQCDRCGAMTSPVLISQDIEAALKQLQEAIDKWNRRQEKKTTVQGRWIYDHWCEFKCSNCGAWSKSEPYRGRENYCPNCGAKMEEQSNGNDESNPDDI